jgi:hypothetical protein
MAELTPFASEEEANDALKAVKDRESFQLFEKRLALTPAALYMRKSMRCPFSFSSVPWSAERAHYLIDDGVSTGMCLWKNLYRVMKVKKD